MRFIFQHGPHCSPKASSRDTLIPWVKKVIYKKQDMTSYELFSLALCIYIYIYIYTHTHTHTHTHALSFFVLIQKAVTFLNLKKKINNFLIDEDNSVIYKSKFLTKLIATKISLYKTAYCIRGNSFFFFSLSLSKAQSSTLNI